MEKIAFEFDMGVLDGLAEEYFLLSSGLDHEGEKFKRMKEEAEKIKIEMLEKIRIKSVLSFFDQFELEEENLRLEDTEFKCKSFSRFNPQRVKAAYVYVITAGDCAMDDRGIVDQIYADIWGTSYLDAGRDCLKKEILQDYKMKREKNPGKEKTGISESFGPGFYGMDANEILKIFHVVDPVEIGVTCGENGVMVPMKSCAGIYLIVNDSETLPGMSCEDCIGSRKSCNACNVRKV